MKNIRRWLCGLSWIALVACGGGGSSSSNASAGTGQMTILATDGPFAHDLVAEADIWVDLVRVNGPGGFRTLYDGPAIQLDLIHLRNGVTQTLVTSDVPAGNYNQIRLRVERARLLLVDGDVFDSDLGTLSLTSTSTSGLKLNIQPPLSVQDGVARTVLLDFDLTKTFHAVPANDPLNASTFLLMPVVHVSNDSNAGEVRGIVREDDGAGGSIGVADATVYLLAPGEIDVGNSLRSTGTEFDGAYALVGVPPGTYDLVARLGSRETRSNGHVVVIGSVTIVDFNLP